MTCVTNAVLVPSPYHHGNLREAVLRAAAEAVQHEGPHAVNLRALAREVGVSHTAPRHHFGDRRGVLTALATQGYAELAERLEAAGADGSFLEVGVAFVAFALERPAHFQVLFRPDLVDVADPELGRARAMLAAQLAGGAQRFATSASRESGVAPATAVLPPDPSTSRERAASPDGALSPDGAISPDGALSRDAAALGDNALLSGHFTSAGLAAWSMAHGFATLALSGAVTPEPGEDLLDLARRTLSHLSPE